MQEITLQETEEKAYQLANQAKNWHYHILTPACKFNTQKRFAFVLENASDGQVFVAYVDNAPLDMGKKLLAVLHGRNMFANGEKQINLSSSAKIILDKAHALNNQGKFWHHHIFFPTCVFNKNQGQWTVAFEDQETGEVLESVSQNEPKEDQKAIETLYYQQKTLV